MPFARDIIVLCLGDFAPAGLSDLLHRHNLGTTVSHTASEAAAMASEMNGPIILALCGNNQEDSVSQVKILVQTEALRNYPLLVVGRDVDALESMLGQHFSVVVALSLPCNNHEILEGLRYIARRVPKESQPAKSEPKPEPESAPAVSAAKPRDQERHRPEVHALYQKHESYPRLLFQELRQLHLEHVNLGGRGLASHSTIEQLSAEGYLPLKDSLRKAVTDLQSRLSERGAAHVCRTTYITHQVGHALKMPAQDLETSQAASFLFALAFAGSEEEKLLDLNYLASSETRATIAETMKRSAEQVRTKLDQPLVADLILAMAHLIGREEAPMDANTFVMASVLVAADLVDRICFNRGVWNPRGAHILMNHLRSGKLSELHPVVMSCVVKFVIEAVSNLPKVFVVPCKQWNNEELQDRAREVRDYVPQSGEVQVPITALEPNMRLARPLHAYDGRKVLDAGLILDEDLIWRIWQLSAIRLLNTPLTVSSEAQRNLLAARG